MNDFDAYALDDNAFYQQEYPFNENYASTSSWMPDYIVKQEAPPMTLELPYTPFHVEQDLYAATNHPSASPWPQEYACPSGWSPYAESTPDLLFTPSNSGHSDSCTNVFDLQFGESLDFDHGSPGQSSSYVYPTSLRDQSQTPPTPPGDPSRRRHPCLVPGCLRRFTSQYTLKVHMQAHKPKPRVTFLCTLGCGERFSRQHDRLRHEVAKHNKVCEFSCDACGRFFSSGKTLGNHKCPVGIGGTRWVHS